MLRGIFKRNRTLGVNLLFDLSHCRYRFRTYHNSAKVILSETSCKNLRGSIPMGGHGISIGNNAEVERIFTVEEVRQYGQLIGDNNPIHQQSSSDHSFPGVIVHGMLTASLFSSIFGTLIPGSIYRSQQLLFDAPVYCNERVVGRVEVTKIKDLRKGVLVTCDTLVIKHPIEQKQQNTSNNPVKGSNGKGVDNYLIKCVRGEATVWLPGVK